jgi:hypothetical protein
MRRREEERGDEEGRGRERGRGREGKGGKEREHKGASAARPSAAILTHSPTAVFRKRSRSPRTSGIRQRACRGEERRSMMSLGERVCVVYWYLIQ